MFLASQDFDPTNNRALAQLCRFVDPCWISVDPRFAPSVATHLQPSGSQVRTLLVNLLGLIGNALHPMPDQGLSLPRVRDVGLSIPGTAGDSAR